MTSTPSTPNGDSGPAPAVFSYAQAAKGRAAATTASAIQTHQANTSGVSTPAKDTSAINTPSAGSEKGDMSVNGNSEVPRGVNPPAEMPTPEWRIAAPSKPTSIPTSPSFGTASTSTLPKEERDDDFILVGVTASESRERAGNASERPFEAVEGRRSKKGKKPKNAEKESEKDKEREKEKEKEEIKPEILVPAPLPTVNIWAQRSQELSKVKPNPVVGQNPQATLETSTVSDGASAVSKDGKKRGKQSGEDAEKIALQNGNTKESNSGKAQRKAGDGANKVKEEQGGKRAGARGSRAVDKDEKATVNQLPPPVEDSVSWPTPETALEEEKRKVQEKLEKEDKEDTTSNKPRPKEKWVPVPYVPSVSFNTPIPPRGGRGRGGARGGRSETGGRPGHSTSNGNPGEKPPTNFVPTGPPSDPERNLGRDGDRSNSVPPTKRQANEQTSGRKSSNTQNGDKSRNSPSKGESNSHDVRQVMASATDSNLDGTQDSRENFRGFRNEPFQGKGNEQYNPSRSSIDRGEPFTRVNDQGKDGNVLSKENIHPSRDRADGRGDRGRGGFRGRGNHANFPNGQPHPQHVFTNGHGPQQPNGYPVRQSNGPYSPPLQSPFSNQYMPGQPRGRGGSRSQSIPNSGMFAQRFMANGQIPPHMGALQTSGHGFEYQPTMQTMSAIPYNGYMDPISVVAMVTMQTEYYFSIDNLCKDVFLRKHMDSQGFVFLAFISGFKRIQSLTKDLDVLRQACQESDILELVRGSDTFDRLRRREGWEKWVLAMEDRDESARNDGPQYFQHASPTAQRLQHMITGHQSMTPTTFSPNASEVNFRPYGRGQGGQIVGSYVNSNGESYQSDTPLSAAVADFAPAGTPHNGMPDSLEAETTFSDNEVANLTLVFLPKSNNDGTKSRSPFHSTSRTFSNGSIDGRSIAEELSNDPRQGRPLTNGTHAEDAPESARRSRSPFNTLSPTRSVFDNAPPVMWVKGQSQQAPVSEQNSQELYTTFRARALLNRQNGSRGEIDADMKHLYEFWSHFLCRNFNASMYLEFRKYAFEDARENSLIGLKNLISYYDEVLNSKKKVIPETIARHYVDLVNYERAAAERPAFDRLRAAWRNGALDMKSRKKIDNLVDQKLKEELERAPHQKSES